MRKLLFLAIVTIGLSSCDVLQQIPAGTTGVTESEASQGIRQALNQGTAKAISSLNITDGFFKSAFYKILLPPEAVKIENTMRSLGLGSLVDKAILSVNRGAEDAVGYATPIFVNAIKEMTITDALNLIRGGDTSATHYFRMKTTAKLTNAFKPVIKSSLDKVEATKYYGDIVNRYNSLPTTFNQLNPDLPSYVTERATDALFNMIAKEEKNIRENPLARTTEILKKVFGRF